jgi:hypothetical protein
MIRTSHSAPDTLTRAADWRASAACRDEDANLFFPDGTTGQWILQIEEAKAVCRRCPVADACLQFALDTGATDGIFGGLTEQERGKARRAARRHNVPVVEAGAEVREPRPERTLQSIFDDNTVRLWGGHLGWSGAAKTGFNSRFYTAKQISFIVDRGRMPEGAILRTCTSSECVLPAHLADVQERGGNGCGTRPGYQRHLRDKTTICAPCRKANSAADRRLQATGSTRVTA